jgi:hypothetical protein
MKVLPNRLLGGPHVTARKLVKVAHHPRPRRIKTFGPRFGAAGLPFRG